MKSIFVFYHFMVRLSWVYLGSDPSSAIRTLWAERRGDGVGGLQIH